MDERRLIKITRPANATESLCHTCYWAHAQKGFRESEEEIFCAFSSPLRKLPFRVRDCTDYLSRTLPTRRQMEEIALIIPTVPTRKPAGFVRTGFEVDSADKQAVNAD